MFDSLILHKNTAEILQSLVSSPPQGILLAGPSGLGKTTVALAWASAVTEESTAIRVIAPDEKGSIGIETIRDLYKAARSKQENREVIIIDDAERMSVEAENAFLKLLEEPRRGLTFILTAKNIESLLPTILSRVQLVPLQPVTDAAIRRAVVAQKPGISDADLTQLLFIASGRPAIALSLLDQAVFDTHRESIQRAKLLITAKPYDRYLQISKLTTDRQMCLEGLGAMQRIAEVQLRSAQNPAQASHWATLAEKIDSTMTSIQNNGNMRAQLLYLFSSY